MPSLTVRPAVPSDAPVLSAIAQRAKAHWGYPPGWLEAWRPALTITAEYVVGHTVLVAEFPEAVVGFAAMGHAGAHHELEHLWVDPASHGKGIGRTLFARISEEAMRSGSTRVRIESDPHAAGFYERCGAFRVGTVPAPVLGVMRELPVLELELAGSEVFGADHRFGFGAPRSVAPP
ncbi:MAG: N-acetyltransferase family protein [Gemmatimonadota bacterium]